jgi:hypothetical protein
MRPVKTALREERSLRTPFATYEIQRWTKGTCEDDEESYCTIWRDGKEWGRDDIEDTDAAVEYIRDMEEYDALVEIERLSEMSPSELAQELFLATHAHTSQRKDYFESPGARLVNLCRAIGRYKFGDEFNRELEKFAGKWPERQATENPWDQGEPHEHCK